ncbi:HemK2/MTQ2 family protein methyltransferase [Halobellus limi]|uniref:Methyltransferase domain-containing protein n=1 Tax=Halobellus limi TaxID=699433 RepID=A0A1H5U466_9EURY|nr:HemK2/MTQ2 family protein methyltransferase [Halobellus limi]QCC47166.1 methyltransferase domain-containing protein [Halobellus limi]SEF69077.1 release factor glutamine methyltransferase [Halobellus limi]
MTDSTEGTEPTDPTEEQTKRDLAARRGAETAVYQPAEDSALLASAVEKRGRGRLLEVGTGSGWVASRAARDVPEVSAVVASDLSPHACRAARERAVAGGVDGATVDEADADAAPAGAPPLFDVVRADLVEPFDDDAFDTVAFNPPYLPTDPENEWDDWMERALSGGQSGRELIDPFLGTVGRVLAPGGVALLLVSSLTGYDAVLDRVRECGFEHEVVVEESYPFETLSVLALTREAEA